MSQKIQQYILKDNIHYIKIHGLHQTAANYISCLINNNLVNTECLDNDIFNFVNQQLEPMIMQQIGYKWEEK